MPPKASLIGRDRNKVKFSKWGVYVNGTGKKLQKTMRSLTESAKTRKARVPGMPNRPLVLTKVSKNKVEVAWPFPVSADTCIRVLLLALGDDWRSFVTDPAGVQGAHQEAATAEDGAVAAEATLSDDASGSRGASAEDQFSPLTPFSGATVASSAATAEARSGVKQLTLKLEAITKLYCSKERGRFEDLQQAYTVNWAAELGQGTYGKVYVGTIFPATGLHRDECQGGFAIKMLRDKEADAPRGSQADAVSAAQEEVGRHVGLGAHPNVVGLVDVGLFWQAPCSATGASPGSNSGSAHIGLVCDLYETDVRQFLQKSSFTQSGMRHVLNSVLEGLRFIHDRGCIHCDLKPANIFMRGAIHSRGCFERVADWGALAPSPHSAMQSQYQIPNSFEVRGGGEGVEGGRVGEGEGRGGGAAAFSMRCR